MVKGSKPFGPAIAFRELFSTRSLRSGFVPINTQIQGKLKFNPAGRDRATFGLEPCKVRILEWPPLGVVLEARSCEFRSQLKAHT